MNLLPMTLNNIMKGARLKVKRANSHIDHIIRDSSPLSKDLHTLFVGPGRSVAPLDKPDCFCLSYLPKESITDHFCPIIGDAVNNLREALDHWMNAAVKAAGSTPKKVYFPFSKEWKDLKTSSSYREIEKAFPDAAEFIFKNIKPCRDTNLHLWAATSLCNLNKHNDFVPIVNVAKINNINARIGTNTMNNCSIGGDANHPIQCIRSDSPISIENNFSTSVEITFPKGAIFESQPVVPTLRNMSQVVSQTLDSLENFIHPHVR